MADPKPNFNKENKEKEIKKLIGIYQDSDDLNNAFCIGENWDGKNLPDKHAPGFLMYVYEDENENLSQLDGTPIKLQDAYDLALSKLKK